MPLLRRSRPAMASLFEVILSGDDPEHLEAVAAEALEEVARVERLLSRHDPTAEIARVNREAADRPVIVDYELFAVLIECRFWADETGGAFDPCAPVGRITDDLQLDPERRAVRFSNSEMRLDLGAYGKGYALDRVSRLIASFGIDSALLHGGTSSVLALGANDRGRPWPLGLRDPFAAPEAAAEIDRLELLDLALSCSAAFTPGSDRSDLVDPRNGLPVDRPDACAVVASTATRAEVLSTALVVMGREEAGRFLSRNDFSPDTVRVAWIQRNDASTTVRWWCRPPEPKP